MRRQIEEDVKKIRQLEGSQEKLRTKFDRKVEEVAVLNKRVKDHAAVNSNQRKLLPRRDSRCVVFVTSLSM